MRWRMALVMMGAVLAMGAARPAGAQAAPDTAGLARVVGAVLVDSVVPRLGDRRPNFVARSATAFDSAVAAVLLRTPGMRPLPARFPAAYEVLGTRGLEMQADTAVVQVRTVSHADTQPGSDSLITTYYETAGWRYLRREFVSGADAGPVRGR
jgi:hypothetical protein